MTKTNTSRGGWTELIVALLTILVSMGLALAGDEVADERGVNYSEFSLADLLDMDVVVGASKYEQTTFEAPSDVTVVSAEEIERYGFRSMSEILQHIRGFHITYDRSYHYAGVRGFSRPGDYNTRILMLIDGHRLNDNLYDMAPIGTDFPVDVSLIERLEVIRGPGSSIYGTNAFFATINVVTKSGKDLYGGRALAGMSSYGGYEGGLQYGMPAGDDTEFLIAGNYWNVDGQDVYSAEFDDPATNDGVFSNNDMDRNHSVFTKLNRGNLNLQASYANRRKQTPLAPWETIFNNGKAEDTDILGYIDLSHRWNPDEATTITSRASYNYYEYFGEYAYDYSDEGDGSYIVMNDDYAIGRWILGEIQGVRSTGERNKIILGSEYQGNLTQYQANNDRDPDYWPYVHDSRSTKSWGVYAQDEYKPVRGVTLNLGLRYDDHPGFGGTTNPRAALIYEPRPRTACKAIYGTAFRAPNAYERYYHDDGLTQLLNPDLGPENIETYELVWEQGLGDFFQGTVSGFHHRIEDLITQATNDEDLLVFKNVESVEADGLEFGFRAAFPHGIRGGVSYTYQDVRDVTTNDELTNSPNHLAKFDILTPLGPEGLTAAVSTQYVDRRKTLAGDMTSDYFMTDLVLTMRSKVSKVAISGGVYNLFDEEYGDPGNEEHEQDIIYQDGRRYRVTLGYSW